MPWFIPGRSSRLRGPRRTSKSSKAREDEAAESNVAQKAAQKKKESEEAKGSGAMAKEYGSAKAIGALYMSAFARRNPSVRAFTVSPGGTHGTGAFDTAPACLPCLCNTVCMPCRMCICHALPLGAARYVDALMDAEYPYASGTFVGCRSGMKGPVADQATIKGGAIYADQPMQEAAYEAVQRFI